MTLNDPLSNALSKMMNAERNRKNSCLIKPVSKTIKEVFKLLKDEGYIGNFTEITDTKGNLLRIKLMGSINKCGGIKPHFSFKKGQIEKFEKRYLPAQGFGIIIVTTPKGIMTHEQAVEKEVGGKVLAYCY